MIAKRLNIWLNQTIYQICCHFTNFYVKTIKLFEILSSKIFKADNNKVVKGINGSRIDETVTNLFKSKKLNHFTKLSNIQLICHLKLEQINYIFYYNIKNS